MATLSSPTLADSTKGNPVVSVPAHKKRFELKLGSPRTATSPSAGLALGKELDGPRTLDATTTLDPGTSTHQNLPSVDSMSTDYLSMYVEIARVEKILMDKKSKAKSQKTAKTIPTKSKKGKVPKRKRKPIIESGSDEDQEPATTKKRRKTQMTDLTNDSASGVKEKGKAMFGEGQGQGEEQNGEKGKDGNQGQVQEPQTLPQQGKITWPAFAMEFKLPLTQEASKSAAAPSRALQKKRDQLKKQQASCHSSAQAALQKPPRDAVSEAIDRGTLKAEEKRLEEIEKEKQTNDTEDGECSPGETVEGMKEERENVLQTSHDEDDQRLSGEASVQDQIVETSSEECGDGDNDSPEVKKPKPERKKTTTIEGPPLNSPYADLLGTLSPKPFTQEQKAAIAAATCPRILGRTAADERGHRYSRNMTNGLTTEHRLMPSADVRDEYTCHPRITDLSQREMIYMAGQHLTWLDPKHDELLSYSKDMLFLLVHALGRFHTGQRGVTIQYINCDEATYLDDQPAAFIEALVIYSTFEVDAATIWYTQSRSALNPRKFSHEYLSHGTIKLNDSTLKQAKLEDLVRDGLFELMPELYAPVNHKRAGLYTEQVVLRRIGYPPRKAPIGQPFSSIYSYDDCLRSVPLTTGTLTLARKLALNFINIPAGTDPSTVEPPLHIFIQFLTLCKRKKADPVFITWIQDHYDANAVSSLYLDFSTGLPLPGFTEVANNLPGYMQHLDLVRDCISVFSLVPLPANDVKTMHHMSANSWVGGSGEFAAQDNVNHFGSWTVSEFDPEA